MENANTIDAKLFNSSLRGDLEGVVDALAQGGRDVNEVVDVETKDTLLLAEAMRLS